MFNELIQWPITTDQLEWQGRHVLRELAGEVHFLFRLTLTGTHLGCDTNLHFTCSAKTSSLCCCPEFGCVLTKSGLLVVLWVTPKERSGPFLLGMLSRTLKNTRQVGS